MEEQRTAHESQQASTSSRHQEEVRALREKMTGLQARAGFLQSQLEQAGLERDRLERRQAEEKEELERQQEEKEVKSREEYQ